MKYKYANSNTGIGDLTFGPLMGEGFELSQPWVTSAPSEGLFAFNAATVSHLLFMQVEHLGTSLAAFHSVPKTEVAICHLTFNMGYLIELGNGQVTVGGGIDIKYFLIMIFSP